MKTKTPRIRPGCLLLLAVLLVLSLAGCADTIRREYKRPEVVVPKAWQQSPPLTGEQVLASDRWWQAFEDPELDRLIEKALKANNDLAVATIKVRKARLQAGLEATNRTPDLSASTATTKKWALDSSNRSRSANASASLSWELDLWGKLAGSRDAAQWEAQATEQDRANTALALVGTTADLYWRIAYLNQAMAAGRQDIVHARRTLNLVRVRYRAGAVSRLDLIQAEQDLESLKVNFSELAQQRTEARNALAVLFDQPPGQDTADPEHLDEKIIPVVAAGIPAAVLGNRPDLKAAEMRLRSTLADVNSTRASYYPDLSLTSSLGTGSTDLVNLLQNPVATLGANLTLPFVQWRKAKLNTRIAEADYEAAAATFRQTLYEALKDVENALAACTRDRRQQASLERSAALARQAEQVAKVRYEAGESGVQDWLDQRKTRCAAELALSQNRYNRLQNTMALYHALGGR